LKECSQRLCRPCAYTCPDHPNARVFVNFYLGSTLDLCPVPASGGAACPPGLPEHIPLVATRLHEPPPPGLLPWAAVHAAKVPLKVWREGGVKEYYNLPRETKLMLSFYAPDGALEKFWHRRGERYEALKREFDAVFAPNFSVYEDSPRIEHLIQMRRSNLVAAEMARQGIAVVPDTGWYNREDLDRWADFVKESAPRAVGFSFQTVGKRHKGKAEAWKSYLAGLRYFHHRLPGDTRIIVVGVNSVKRMRGVLRVVGERPVSFLDTTSFYTARKGGVLTLNYQEPAAPLGISRDAAFFESVKVFRQRIAAAKSSAKEGVLV